MGQVNWTLAALDDVDAIAAYIARDSPDEAALFVVRLFQTTKHLAEFPNSGRVVPETHDQARREILVGAYRIMYRVEDNRVWITGVIHGARDYGKD